MGLEHRRPERQPYHLGRSVFSKRSLSRLRSGYGYGRATGADSRSKPIYNARSKRNSETDLNTGSDRNSDPRSNRERHPCADCFRHSGPYP